MNRDELKTEAARMQYDRMIGDHFLIDVLKVEPLEFAEGSARVMLPVRPDLLNGLGIVQGGAIFTLGDYACAAAANYAEPAVSIETSISNLHAGKCEKIFAEAREINRSNRFSVCQCRITDENGTHLAQMSARFFIIKK